MPMYLIIIDMSDFDIVLGIDFLNKYKVKIEYKKKKFRFTSDCI